MTDEETHLLIMCDCERASRDEGTHQCDDNGTWKVHINPTGRKSRRQGNIDYYNSSIYICTSIQRLQISPPAML